MYLPAVSTVYPSRLHDERIVQAIREGSRASEEELYRRHAPSVLRLATRLLRSTDDARDALQDTFVTAFEELSRLRDPSAAQAWLHTICVRHVHRRFRRRRLLRALGLDRTEEDAKLESQASPDLGPEARLELRLLDLALDALPAEQMIAWVLRRVEGLTLEEVAVATGCSLATAKRRLAAAAAAVARFTKGPTA